MVTSDARKVTQSECLLLNEYLVQMNTMSTHICSSHARSCLNKGTQGHFVRFGRNDIVSCQ
jgi:hypothetical protein